MCTRQYLILLLLCVMAVQACEPDPDWPEHQDIAGAWELKSATRNNKTTGTLAGTYFVFSDSGYMKSNLPLIEQQGEWMTHYAIIKDTLYQKGIPAEQYHIKAWSDTSLTLEFMTRGIPFLLRLSKTTLEKIYTPVVDSTSNSIH